MDWQLSGSSRTRTKIDSTTQRAEDLEWLDKPESIISEGHVRSHFSRPDDLREMCLETLRWRNYPR